MKKRRNNFSNQASTKNNRSSPDINYDILVDGIVLGMLISRAERLTQSMIREAIKSMKKHKTLRRDYIIAEIALSVAFVAIFEQVAPAQTFISLIKKLESIILDY
ncbi:MULTISPECIES: hypothetical protein [Escherichia]|uniref:hypothetical protein n=1 Tax=Escherichia TaxID=561 RepID=UPI000B7E515A|nr:MULTISPECIES: hypothetical protein [Escherichia]EEZ6118682.1 hypothetical protein [Escherichia coli O73]EFJ7160803.1 hypothetical protein [Escherichia coli]MBB2350907.1 hypothetical protein [Escherichia sp. 92.1228]MCZ9249638.1 hypothetical protein [Escherichia albertii]MIA81614.1 hypothetical protein [Escherichia coli]